jgi:hypothetical protein
MPQMSLYLNDKTLESVKARAAADKLPVSQVVRLAVEHYLQSDERKSAKKRVAGFLREKPLGGMKGWTALHRDRTEADDRRG